MRNLFLALPLAAALTISAGVAVAAEGGAENQPHDQAWVEQQVETCAACHGPTGISPIEMYPVIAGQYRDYLVHAMTEYRDGERKNPIMALQAQGLTDKQIKALARFYSRQDSPLRVPAVRD